MKPSFAFVLLTRGIFGGAERRFTQLTEYLYYKFPNRYYFIITWDLYHKIIEVFPNYPIQILIPIGSKVKLSNDKSSNNRSSEKYIADHPGIIKRAYRFVRSFNSVREYFQEIDRIKKEKNVKCFLGIYNGILPLYFYLGKVKRNVGVAFADMDSWFSDVIPPQKKYWYRKFSSFNYAMENSDFIDFLSPFILKGVRARGLKIKEESICITPCSFTDYSNCRIGVKENFQVAFVGRLEQDKNPELFLEAAIILLKKYPEIIFHIMGEGRLSTIINEKVSKIGSAKIIFHGFHPHPTEVLANTSAFVSIQTTNNYPSQSVLEAMGCGNAIVATDVGDTRMFINENNGILINLDKNELVTAIETLFLNSHLRTKLCKFANNYVRENHTIEKVSEYYVDLFNKTSLKFIEYN